MKRRLRLLISAIVREPKGPRPAGRIRSRLHEWRERAYFHLSRAEWDARVQIGMSLWHTERLAYPLLHEEKWDALETSLWPEAEWIDVLDEHRGETHGGQP